MPSKLSFALLSRAIIVKIQTKLAFMLPSKKQIHSSLFFILFTLGGGIILAPLVYQLPVAGWDWYYFFNMNNPAYNLTSSSSAYPPFTQPLLGLLTWLPWRTSLALLNSISLLTIALATYKNKGDYLSILLGLISPPVLILLWIGHPDGLALLGMLTGLLPFQLMKPQLSIWNMFKNRFNFSWTISFLLLSLLIWPLWPLKMMTATLTHEAAFGWAVTGWPIALLGLILILGAGQDSYRLMAAGCLICPYLMPYHLAILTPAIGSARGVRKIIIWISTWILALGVGLGGSFRFLNLLFPICAYCCNQTWDEYKTNITHGFITIQMETKRIFTRRLIHR